MKFGHPSQGLLGETAIDHAPNLKDDSFGIQRRASPPQTFIEAPALVEVSDTRHTLMRCSMRELAVGDACAARPALPRTAMSLDGAPENPTVRTG